MPVKQKFVKVVGGTGGANKNSIPAYADDKAPNGDQIIINGKQLMLPNDFELVCVDQKLLVDGLDNIRAFFSKDDKYCRVWELNRSTMTGDEIVEGKQTWVEHSHLADLELDGGEPEPDVEVTYEDIGKAVVMLLELARTVFGK